MPPPLPIPGDAMMIASDDANQREEEQPIEEEKPHPPPPPLIRGIPALVVHDVASIAQGVPVLPPLVESAVVVKSLATGPRVFVSCQRCRRHKKACDSGIYIFFSFYKTLFF